MSEQSERKRTRGTPKRKKQLSFSESSIRGTPALAEGAALNLLFSVAPEVGDIDLFPTCWGVLPVCTSSALSLRLLTHSSAKRTVGKH